MSLQAAQVVMAGRRDTAQVLQRDQDRLIVVVGPCSVHDVRAGVEYGTPLLTSAPPQGVRGRGV